MGFFSGLEAESYDRTYSDWYLVRRIARYFRPHSRRLAVIILALLVLSAAGVAEPLLVSRGVDMLRGVSSQLAVLVLGGTLLALGVLIWLTNWVRRRQTTRAVAQVMLALREDAFAAAASHDLSFYDEFASGRIVSRITSDTQDFAQVVVLVTDLASQVAEAGVLFLILLGIDWRLTLWMTATLPPLFLAALALRRLARKVTRAGMRAMANVNAAIKETVTGIAVAKNFRQEASIFHQFNQVNQLSYRTNARRGFVLSLVFPTLNALGGMATALLVYVGGLSAAQGFVTAGSWYLFLNSLDRFWFPVLNLSAFWTQVQNGLSAAERVFALIDAKPAVVQRAQQPVPRLKGDIRFEQVEFRYKTGRPVLQDFNLHIPPGQSLALVGHTGAGKTSIARLVARFYEFQRGRILIDGLDIRTLDLEAYRRQLGIVPQVPFLFSGTVADNIRYARPEVSEGEILALARRIGEGDWLESLPQGLQTPVGERGALLSMGQRQLVSLMRVLVQQPAIFILDEATANIDPFTESQIQEALELIMAETTSIIIAHRLSTVKAADRILVLQEGQIIEDGTHAQLMAAGGHYADLYNTYFRHQSLQYIEQARRRALEALGQEEPSPGD